MAGEFLEAMTAIAEFKAFLHECLLVFVALLEEFGVFETTRHERRRRSRISWLAVSWGFFSR